MQWIVVSCFSTKFYFVEYVYVKRYFTYNKYENETT